MRAYELVAMWIAAGAVAVPVVTWAVLWLLRRDRIFSGVDPGEVPADIEDAPTRRVGPGTEYSGEMPPRSAPPAGISPGLAGVVLDGSADGRDIAAMVLDLARRGWLVLADAPGRNQSRDWQVTRVDQPLDATLDLNEVYLITNIAAPGGTTRMSELRGKGDNRLGLVQLDLAREVVARGWYPAPPSQPSDVPMAVLGLGGLLGVVVALVNVSSVSVTAGSVVVACAYLTSLIVRGNTPRAALGTALRIQVLGFRRYLEDAQSHQFSYIDAARIFREYLPWAVVFGLEQRWAEVFAELNVVAGVAELHLAQDLRWFAGIKGPKDALTPTPERPELDGIPRRLAPRANTGDPEADAETVLVVREAVADVPALIDAVPRGVEAAPADEVLVERFSPPSMRRSVLTALTATGRKVVAAVKLAASDTGRGLVIMAKGVATMAGGLVHRAAALRTSLRQRTAAQTPSGDSVDPVAEAGPAVRQWVPRPHEPPEVGTQEPRTTMPDQTPASVPTAPLTPRRPPGIDPTPAVPVPIVQATPARQLPPWSDWLAELDRAMSGDFDADGPDATDGGTVISGPERFDVLLTAPLWPDVPLDTRPDRRAG